MQQTAAIIHTASSAPASLHGTEESTPPLGWEHVQPPTPLIQSVPPSPRNIAIPGSPFRRAASAAEAELEAHPPTAQHSPHEYRPSSSQSSFPVLHSGDIENGTHAKFEGIEQQDIETCEKTAVYLRPQNDSSSRYNNPVMSPNSDPVLICDLGSIGNLAGDGWAAAQAEEAIGAGKMPSYEQRRKPLEVSGVGKGSEQCDIDCKLPVGLISKSGKTICGDITMPVISDSKLPGLFGLTGMKRNRTIIDTNDNTMYFVGPGDYDLLKALPPGTEVFQCKIAPTGHMVLPCANFSQKSSSDALSLHTKSIESVRISDSPPPKPPNLPAAIIASASSSAILASRPPPAHSVE